MSYDLDSYRNTLKHWLFQSLWNRAVSYDSNREEGFAGWNEVSIPLEQGSVLRQEIGKNTGELGCFNPFGTGQCLTTIRQITHTNKKSLFQSLWNRAVSYDKTSQAIAKSLTRFQSLWNRAVSYDCSGVIKPCATRLAEATSQLFPRLRELGLDLVKC